MKLFYKIILMSTMLTSFFMPSNKSSPNIIDNNRLQEKVKFENVHIKKFKDSSLDKYISKYNFYKMSFDRNIILADTFDESNYIPNIYEFKLIINPIEYLGFEEYEDLKNEKYVVEIIKIANNNLYKEFHTINNNSAKQIIDKAVFINEEHSKYTNLITSLNAEGDFKSKLKINNNSLLSTVSYPNNIEDTDNQGMLDNFLSVANRGHDYIQTNSNNDSLGIINNENVSDDPITDLIDKNKFKTIGIKKNGGSEWGYLLNTYNYYSDGLKTDLIIYDVETIKYDYLNNHFVFVKPVLTYSYLYSKKDDSVTKMYANNYCLGDPEYNFGIKYISFDGNLNNVEHKNPDEPGYNINEDNGLCINETNMFLNGSQQNFSGSKEKIVNAIIKAGAAIINLKTSNLDIFSQFVVSTTYNIISKVIFNALNSVVEKENKIDNFEKYYKSAEVGPNSIKKCKEAKRFNKSIYLSMETSKDSKESKLLYKSNYDDKISYRITLNDNVQFYPDYTSLALNLFSVNIYNDNTTFMQENVEYIDSLENKWAYFIGYDIKSKELKSNSDFINQPIVYGYKEPQIIKFTPKESGYYNLILKNYTVFTEFILEKDGNIYTDYSGAEKNLFENEFGGFLDQESYLPSSNKKNICISSFLSANKEYNIYIKNNPKNPSNNPLNYFDTEKFGTGLFCIYKLGSAISSINPSQSTIKRTSVNNSYSTYYTINNFMPIINGEYTFDFNCSYLDEEDLNYYKYRGEIAILDEKFNILATSTNTDFEFGLRFYLKGNKQYYIASKLLNSDYPYTLSVIKEKYLPFIPTNSEKCIYVNFNEKKKYFIIKNNYYTKSFSFQLKYNDSRLNGISLKIYDTSMKVLAKKDNIYNNVLSIELVSNYLYIIELSCPYTSGSIYGNFIYSN